jgi:hypothetical protein
MMYDVQFKGPSRNCQTGESGSMAPRGPLGCFGPVFRRPSPFAFDLVALNGGLMFLEAAQKVMGVFQQPVKKTIVCNSLQI